MMKSPSKWVESSTPSIPAMQGMEGWKPITVLGFHTFHTFHTFLLTYTRRRTHTRAHACTHLYLFGMEGMEGMEQQVNTRLSGFHTLPLRSGRYGT